MTPPSGNRWHPLLHARFRGQASPLLVMPDTLWSGASLWAGARAWTRAFRAADITAGDRVVCALPPGPAFVQVLLACLWEGITMAPVSGSDALRSACAALHPRLVVAMDVVEVLGCPRWIPDAASQPPLVAAPLPRVRSAYRDAPALLLHTSGSTGTPRWIGLSTDNVLAVLDSHREALQLSGATVLSVLPWHHAFGLVLGLLAALRDADEIVVAHTVARDDQALAALCEAHPITHVDLVPALVERWAAEPSLHALLHTAHGIVGGAPMTPAVCTLLRGTGFRVGYGQTEASPGIMLGARGVFLPALIGQPVGCEVRIEPDGSLAFRGPNACHGVLVAGQYTVLSPDRWHATGDRAEPMANGTWRFRERAVPAIKLANGRWVDCHALETQLRHVPGVRDAVVMDDGHGALAIGCATDGPAVSPDALHRALGTLRGQVSAMRCVAADHWPWTPKGTVDRGALRALLLRAA